MRDALPPVAHADGERGVYLQQVKLLALSKYFFFFWKQRFRAMVSVRTATASKTRAPCLPLLRQETAASQKTNTDQPYFAAQATRTRRWGTSPGSSGRSARSGTRCPRLRWPCNARAAEGLPGSGQTAEYKQNVSTRRQDCLLSVARPINSIHTHKSLTDTLRPVSPARSATPKQRAVRNAPLLDRQEHFCVTLVFFGAYIKAVLCFCGAYGLAYNLWPQQKHDYRLITLKRLFGVASVTKAARTDRIRERRSSFPSQEYNRRIATGLMRIPPELSCQFRRA